MLHLYVDGWARRTPDAPALSDDETSLTYRELSVAMRAAAALLRSSGILPGDRVVIAGRNTVAWVVAFLGSLSAGAIAVPMNIRSGTTQVRHQLKLIDPRLVLVDGQFLNQAAEWDSPTAAYLEEFGSIGRTASKSHSASERGTWSPPQLGDVAVVSFTSGTTGEPKGVVLTHRAVDAAARAFATAFKLRQDASTLVLAPLFHNTGFIDQVAHLTLVGGSVRLLREFHTADAVDELSQHPVSFITAVPSVLRLLMLADGAESAFRRARLVLYGGSPMPEPWSRELLERWPHLQVVHGYGLTEYTSPVALLPSEYAGTRGDSVGFPVRGARVRLADESGNEVPMGATGEILVTGPSRMVEYWKNPEATSAKLHGDWLRTGDLGRREDLLLYVEGRLDDVINRGGEKIQPAFVEAAISTFPDVAEVAVFPVPDPILQERLMAVVRTRSGRALLGDQLRRHLLRSVPDYAIPEEFIVVRELPRSQSGKVDRRSLVATYAKRGARDGEVADVQT